MTHASDFNMHLAEFARSLTARGVPVWATTNSRSSEDDWMHRPGLVSSCDCGLAKPDLAIFAFAAKRVRVEPHEIVFVDDIASHVEAAHSAGFDAIQFYDADKLISELARHW